MVAIGMVAVILSIGIPTLFRNMHQDSMRKAISDVMEACSHARARAILDGTAMELRIRPIDRSFAIAQAAVSKESSFGASAAGGAFTMEGDEVVEKPVAGGTGFSVRLSERIMIEGLGVNGEDWTEDEEARVRFYPNGTSDEMSIVLMSDKGERANITLEVVTGMADVEHDITKFKAR